MEIKTAEKWPLEGFKVVDFTQAIAGPSCSLMLADFGADVIKIEPPTGDHFRPAADGCLYINYNRNKRGIVINLKKKEGPEIVLEMLKKADILLENFVPGTLDKFRLGYEAVKEVRPEIIYCSISGFGQRGPYRSRPAYDPILQAMSGIMDATGEPDRPPVRILPSLIDYMAGLNAAFAILASLMDRSNTGKGRRLDISLIDVALAPMGPYAAKYKRTGELPQRAGSAQAAWAPYQNFETKDGLLLIAASTTQMWKNLCKALKLEALGKDTRFDTLAGRRKHRAEIVEALNQVTKQYRRDELEKILLAEDVPCGKVLNVGQIIEDPHVLTQQIIEEIDYPTMGNVLTTKLPIIFGGHRPPTRRNAPLLGEHTEEILREYGYDDEKINTFLSNDVVRQYGK